MIVDIPLDIFSTAVKVSFFKAWELLSEGVSMLFYLVHSDVKRRYKMNDDAKNKPLETQPEDNGGKAEKMFTQEEVNKIVSERLAKERSKSEQAKNSADEQKAAELTARENKLTCKEYLLNKNYPLEMLDSFDTSDPEKFKNTADSIYNAFCNKTQRQPLPAPMFSDGRYKATPKYSASDNTLNTVISDAFSPDNKHKPKKYPGCIIE